jgi:hypothetical protein
MTSAAYKWEPRIVARYEKVFDALQAKCPALVPEDRWRFCIRDGGRFLARWGERAQSLNWSSADLFGLIEIPERPSSRFDRLSRYDRLGLCWLLQGMCVTVLTEATAMIEKHGHWHHHPIPQEIVQRSDPLGDSLDDLK